MERLAQFKRDHALVEEIGFNPYYAHLASGLDDPVIIDGKQYINLAANNYLGLACDPRVKQAIIQAVNQFGASMCGTPIATGSIELYRQLENKLASFVGVEDAILLPSCYQANNGLFSAIANKGDTIIIDHFAHSSLIEGAKSVGCKIRPFLHNNMQSLEKNLANTKGRMIVVTESVFSTEGAIAPFEQICQLCQKYNALPVIDDSHGIGVLGEQGRGILNYKKIKSFNGIYTTSLGKALANAGGIIAGSAEMMEYLRYYCSHLIYSTALAPGCIAGTDKVIDILLTEGEQILTTMWNHKHKLSQALKTAGYQLVEGEAPITSILCGDTKSTLLMAKQAFERGILATPFVYPSVPRTKGVLRLIAGANLKNETIEQAIAIFRDLKS